MEMIFTAILTFILQFFGIQQVEPAAVLSEESVAAEVLSVTDGDTITVWLDGKEEKIRYIGIDTPEPYRDGEPACFSKEATEKNKSLVAGKTVQLVADVENRDRFERLLRYVYVDGVMVNEVLMQGGYATTLTIKPNTAKAERLAAAESEARAAGVGLWSACNGQIDSGEAQTDVSSGAIEILTTELSDGQRQVLEMVGIDTTTITVTQEMIRCGQQAVGTDRLTEITSGDLPSVMESFRLVGCYR